MRHTFLFVYTIDIANFTSIIANQIALINSVEVADLIIYSHILQVLE